MTDPGQCLLEVRDCFVSGGTARRFLAGLMQIFYGLLPKLAA
jgi:hypothetical protein